MIIAAPLLPSVVPMPGDLRRALLERLIDDAGLFPPARLAMPDALRDHAANRIGPLSWVQGRFIVPASQLGAVLAAWPEGLPALRLSVVADTAGQADGAGFAAALDADLAAAAALERADSRVRVELVEVRVPEPDLAGEVPSAVRRAAFAGPVAAFAEAPDSTDAGALRAAVAAVTDARAAGATRLGAKVRCGGVEASMIPAPEAVAAFLAACVAGEVPFKATAGLHHPVRGIDPASGMRMHGFVNLLVATALLRAGALDDAERIIGEEEASAFSVAAEALGWRELTVDVAAVAAVRETSFTAYGSCSFDEPTGDLAALGWLP